MRSSSLPLLVRCYGSLILPQDRTEGKFAKQAEEAAVWGKIAHYWKEHGTISNSIGTVRDRRAFSRAIKASGDVREVLWPPGGVHETSVALRIDGTRDCVVSPNPLYDEYPGDAWVTGTADYRAYLFGDELWIDDLKTGKFYPDPEEPTRNRFPQDPSSAQVVFYALSNSKALGYNGPVHTSITHKPRLPIKYRNRPADRLWALHTPEQLEEFYLMLERMYQDIQMDRTAGGPRTRPGDHCTFCPSAGYCIDKQEWKRN